MGKHTIDNNSRFADTFLHPREARLDPKFWFQAFASSGLQPFGLFDRYAECDDLPNPLWSMPDYAELSERCFDGRFKNNLELFIRKRNPPSPSKTRFKDSFMFGFTSFPKFWQRFEETSDVSFITLQRLWARHQKSLLQSRSVPIDKFLDKHVSPKACQRLARIGVILPHLVESKDYRDLLLAPMSGGDVSENSLKSEGDRSREIFNYIAKNFPDVPEAKIAAATNRLKNL